jgi:hypothetical protein
VRKVQDTDGVSPASHGVPLSREGWQPSDGISGSFAVESAAAFAWNRWQLCYGISGSFRVERVAALPWNQWQDSPGIGGSFAVEYAMYQLKHGLLDDYLVQQLKKPSLKMALA